MIWNVAPPAHTANLTQERLSQLWFGTSSSSSSSALYFRLESSQCFFFSFWCYIVSQTWETNMPLGEYNSCFPGVYGLTGGQGVSSRPWNIKYTVPLSSETLVFHAKTHSFPRLHKSVTNPFLVCVCVQCYCCVNLLLFVTHWHWAACLWSCCSDRGKRSLSLPSNESHQTVLVPGRRSNLCQCECVFVCRCVLEHYICTCV